MQTKIIEYKGISRVLPHHTIEDGYLDEMINLRFREGKLQPIKEKVKEHNEPVLTDSTGRKILKIWLHRHDRINNFLAMVENSLTSKYELILLDESMVEDTLIKEYDNPFDIVTLKRFLIVIAKNKTDKFLWKDEQYTFLEISKEPIFDLSITDSKEYPEKPEGFELDEAVLGQYFANLNNASKDNRFHGGMTIRAAYRMFDGSLILHTRPKFISNGNLLVWISELERDHRIIFHAAGVNVTFDKNDYEDINSDLIQSVVFFASKAEQFLTINEDTITQDNLHLWSPTKTGRVVLNNELDINENFKLLHDTDWYKVGEYDVSLIKDETIKTERLDLKGFYQDYATREKMPLDQFSHHQIVGDYGYNYNSRLILSDIKQFLGWADLNNYQIKEPFTVKQNGISQNMFKLLTPVKAAIEYIINTDEGEKNIYHFTELTKWKNNQNDLNAISLQGIIGYPDARAKKLNIYIKFQNEYRLLRSFKLTASKNYNFAYYIQDMFNAGRWEVHPNDAGIVTNPNTFFNYHTIQALWLDNGALLSPDTLNLNIPYDNTTNSTNKLQISELENPFFFPAKYSYIVGTGKIIATASNTEPLSTGQYGEYPLIVFTTEGMWAMFQGENTLFSKISPLNGEVVEDKEKITPTGTGVLYTTPRGLYIVTGNQVNHISKIIEGMPLIELQANTNYQKALNHLSTVKLIESVSKINFLTYLKNANIGFDKIHNEIIISNPDNQYCYIYQVEENIWTKTSQNFKLLVHAYPNLLAWRKGGTSNGLINLSKETISNEFGQSANTQSVIVTRPVKLSPHMDRVFRIRQGGWGHVVASSFAQLLMFGSNDMRTWQLMNGNDRHTGQIADIIANRSHLKVRYYVFIFSADYLLKKDDTELNNYLTDLTVGFIPKLQNKIR